MSKKEGHESQDSVSYSYQDTTAYRRDHSSSTQGASPDQSAQQLFQLPSERFAQEHTEPRREEHRAYRAVTVAMPFEEAGEFLTYYEHGVHAPGEELGRDITITATMPQGEVRAFRRLLSQLPPTRESMSFFPDEQTAQERAAYEKHQKRLSVVVIAVTSLLLFVALPFFCVFMAKVTS